MPTQHKRSATEDLLTAAPRGMNIEVGFYARAPGHMRWEVRLHGTSPDNANAKAMTDWIARALLDQDEPSPARSIPSPTRVREIFKLGVVLVLLRHPRISLPGIQQVADAFKERKSPGLWFLPGTRQTLSRWSRGQGNRGRAAAMIRDVLPEAQREVAELRARGIGADQVGIPIDAFLSDRIALAD